METKDIIILAVTLLILGEVTYLLTKLNKTTGTSRRGTILVDTSVLMDGRIASIASTGFITDTLVVPRSVIGELQLLADGNDSDRRTRARHGLDIVSELQKMEQVNVEILQDGSRAPNGVDERLLELAKRNGSRICTQDYNLNKVAVVEGIKVLNINELSQSLRVNLLPGEQVLVEVIQKGQESGQGVGYLADGTMVVVDRGLRHMGKSILVEVVRNLQTAAGKMIFAKCTDSVKSEVNEKGTTHEVKRALLVKNTQVKVKKQSTNNTTSNNHPKSNIKSKVSKTRQKQSSTQSNRLGREDNLIALVNNQPDNEN